MLLYNVIKSKAVSGLTMTNVFKQGGLNLLSCNGWQYPITIWLLGVDGGVRHDVTVVGQ